MGGISTLSYLSEKISEKEKYEFLKTFVDKQFLAYDYDREDFVAPDILFMDEYLEDDSYSLRYKTEDFAVTCSTKKSHISYSIDGDNRNSNIILEICDHVALIFPKLKYSKVDSEGDRPDSLPKSVESVTPNVLFKYNYFGSGYIEKYGKEFFENFPADQVRFITDSVVRVDLVDDLFSSISEKRQEEVIAYLASKGISEVEFYDADEHVY